MPRITSKCKCVAPPSATTQAELESGVPGQPIPQIEAGQGPADDELLARIQEQAFSYFLSEVNPENGLVADSSQEGSPSSIAATGFALSCYPIAIERGYISRAEGLERALKTLRFFAQSEQSTAKNATGYKGFYYHFLDGQSGQRTWKSELSSIDTGLLLMGALTCAAYFESDKADERELRQLANELYKRVDWQWMCDGAPSLTQGWRPERGFLPYHWTDYNEALFLYVLGLGSPSHPLPIQSYQAWTKPFRWKKIYEQEYVYAGPLFIHQFPHCWLDLRGLQDAYMRQKGSDYFENSRRATYVQQQYAIRNPRGFEGYSDHCWGLTACDGPGALNCEVDGRSRSFYGYKARGVPFGADDGTLAPWAACASLPFCPEIVLPTLHYFNQLELGPKEGCGFEATFNPTFPDQSGSRYGWVSPHRLGINQGPMVMMIENYRSELVWQLLKGCEPIVKGLRRAGFRGGWLEKA